MAKIVWSGAQDANWFNPNNWNPAIVPTAGVTVIIPAGLTNYPVVSNGNGVTISQNFALGGTFTLASTGSNTDLIVNGGAVRTLSGGGSIILSDSGANRIYSNQGGTVLENVDDTITGAGQIYSSSGLSILNDAAGVINASAANNQLDVFSISVTNNGLVEATGAAGLLLYGVTLNQSGGGTLSANGGNVYLNGALIQGGALQTSSGLIETSGNGTVLNGAATLAVTITAGSTVQDNDGLNLTLLGVINDKGVIKLTSGQDGVHFDNSDLIFNGGITDKLQGGGVIQLSDSGANRIYSNNANTVLENVDDTITGAGQIYSSSGLSILNDAAGVINASAANNQLDVFSISVTNNGLVEATGAAGLLLNGVTLNQSGGGTLSASGGNVYLNGALIQGGALQTSSGLIETSGNGTVLNGAATLAVTITAGSTVQDNDGLNLTLLGVINDKGVIKLTSGQDGVHFDNSDLIFNGGITDKLQGGGVIQLSDSGANRIFSNNANTVLENVDDTITGAGQIFANSGLSILNDAAGVINASAAVNGLSISSITVNNKGLVEATSTGGLSLSSMTLNNVGGTLSAVGALVNLNGTTVSGGTLTSSGLGRIQTSGNGTLINGSSTVTLTANSALWVSDGQNLSLSGTIANSGVLSLRSGQNGVNFDNADLLVQGSGTVTLTGGGSVNLVTGGANRIFSNQGGTILDNINNKIFGSGQIFAGSGLSIVNEAAGQILADNTAQTLSVSSITITNKAFLGSESDGVLTVNSATLNQSGAGVLSALQGNVFVNGSHISGGALTSKGGYVIATNGNGTLLDGGGAALSITAGSTVRVSDGNNLSLTGAIANSGVLFVDSGQDGVHNDNTDLLIQGAVNLTGGGTVLLSNSPANRIFTNTGGSVLTNTNDTIVGAGQIFSNSGLSIVNAAAGVIEAGAGETLSVSLAVANSGLLEGNGGALSVSGSVTGAGLAEVANGGSATFSGATALSRLIYATPYAGTITLPSGATPAITGFAAGDTLIVKSNANVTSLSYQASQFQLSFLNGATTVETFTLYGGYTAQDFQLTTGAGFYGVVGVGDTWQGGTAAWSAGPWSQGLPNGNDDVVISSGSPTVTASIGSVRSLSVVGAGSIDFAGVTGNNGSGSVYDATLFALDNGAGQGGASFSAGTVTVAASAQLTLGNATLSASDNLTTGAVTNNGAISLNGAGAHQALFNVNGAAGFGTVGVASGSVSLAGNSAIEFGSGGLSKIAAGASLSLTGAAAFVEIAGHLGANSALTGLSTISGALSLENGAAIAPTGALYDSGVLNVDDVSGAGGTVVTLPTLYVTGALNIGNSAMTAADQVNVTTLRSIGAIRLAGGASAQALLNVNSAATLDAPVSRLFGSVSLSGHSALQFASGVITAIDASASLRLQGANAFVQLKTAPNSNSALTSLAIDAGSMSLENGASLADTAALKNTGTLSLDGLLGEGGSSLSDTLTLTNAGTLTVGNANLSAATTLTTKALINTATINMTGSASFQALLNVGSAAGFGTTGVLTGAVTLAGNAAIKFASGGITTIAGGSSLDLFGNTALIQNNLAGTNTGLKTLSTVAGTLTLDSQVTIASTAAIVNTGVIFIDATGGEGGSQLTTTAALTNSGKLTLGNGALSAPDLVKAASLNNSGTLNVIGGGSNQALVNVTSAAGFGSAGVLTGAVGLAGDSAIEFASGTITTVASGASLTMTGGSAFLEAGVTNSNSALTTLSADSGLISLHNNVLVASSRALTVSAGAQFLVDANAGEGGSNLTFNGALTNAGALALGDATLAQADLIQATALANTGSLTLIGGPATQALLNVTQAAAFGAGTNVTGTVTLTNNAAIAFSSGSLTGVALGASLTLDGPNAYIEDGATNADNALSNLSVVNGAFNLLNGGSVSTVGLSNSGQIEIWTTRGTGLSTSMSFSGALTNTGGLSLLAAANTLANISVSATSLNNTGSISLVNGNAANASLLSIASAAGFGTLGVLTGTVNIGAASAISFASGTISTIANGATLELAAANGYLEDGTSNSNSALSGLSTVNGTLQIDFGSAIATTSTGFSNAGTINIDAATGGGGSLAISGALTNSGAINIGAGSNLASSAQISAASLSNTGSITLSGGGATQALLRINGVAGFGSTGVFKGAATLSNDAAIQFNSGAITSIAAGGMLRLVTAAAELEIGASSPTNALATLGTIAGTLDLDNGAGFSDSAALAISGGLFLDSFSGEGGSSFSDTNTITNSGTLNLGNTNSAAGSTANAGSLLNTGTINVTGNGSNHFAELNVLGTLTNNGSFYAISDVESISGTVAGTGTFDIWNGANLGFAAGVGNGQSVTFDSAGTLGVNASGNVFQASIAGFGSGDAIQLSNFAGTGAGLSYMDNGNHTGVLTVTNASGSTLLNFAGDYTTGSFSVTGNSTSATLGFV